MATEDQLIIDDRGIVLGGIETTYGTAPSLAVANALYVSDVSFDFEEDQLARTPLSPERQGVLSVFGAARVTYSMSTEIAMQTISGADGSDAPHCDVMLRAAGFTRTADAGDKAYIYVLNSNGGESAAFEIYQMEAGGVDANLTLIRGARHSFSLDFVAGEVLSLSCDGIGLANTTVRNTVAASAAVDKGITWYSDKPFVGRNAAHLEVVNLGDDTVYGGGSLGDPDNTLEVLSLSVDGAMNVSEQRGLKPAGSDGRIRLAPDGPATMSVVIEAARIGDIGVFNPYTLRSDNSPLEFRIKFTDGANHMALNAYAQIVGISKESTDGRQVYSLDCELRYPEDTDGDPSVGLDPEQKFEQGTNKGLFLDLAPSNPGVLALSFWTS